MLCENCTSVVLCLARLGASGFSKRRTGPGKPNAKSLGTNTKNTSHTVYATSRSIREKKGPSLGKKNKSKFLISEVPTLWNLRTDLRKWLIDRSDVPEARIGTLPKTCTSSKRKTKLHSTHCRKNGYCRLPQQKEPEEREFVVDSRASLHMVSKRDLNSAELKTMRTSRSPTTVMTANGEVQTREKATACVKELDLVVTVMLLEETLAVLSLGKL